jgi:hypothetical protein
MSKLFCSSLGPLSKAKTTMEQCYKTFYYCILLFYCRSKVLVSFCVIKQYYHRNCNRMAVNYHGKKFNNIGPLVANLFTMVIYHGRAVIYRGILTLDIVGTVGNMQYFII